MRYRIFSRSKGSWTIVINLPRDPSTGRYPQRWLTIRGSKPTAEKKAIELLYNMDGGSSLNPSKIKLEDYLDIWLHQIKPRVRSETYRRYCEICLMHIKPVLGYIPIDDLRTEDIRQYYNNLNQSPNSIRQHHAVLHHALKDAVKGGLINRNIIETVSPPPKELKEMQTWTTEEMNQFIEFNRELKIYPLFYLALFTGMRRSELLGLQWSDIDWLGSQLSVRRAYHQRGKIKEFTIPKTKKSIRSIALSPSTIKVLRDLYAKTHQNRNLGGASSQGVFWSDGQTPSPNMISKAWQRACKKAGVRVIRFHDARHTHATILLQQGIHPKIVQERLGHYSIQITLDTYSHVVPGMQESAADGFDKVLNRAN